MKSKDKSRLTATKMVFIRHTAANNLSSEKLHHFCSHLYPTWCTLNICPLHFVCFIFYFCNLSRGHHMGVIIALSTKFTSCEYAHTNILKRDVAIKYFHFPNLAVASQFPHWHLCCKEVTLYINVTWLTYTVRSKRFRTEFFENRRNMRKTHTFFLFKLSSIGIYTGFCLVVQFQKSCWKFLFLDLL